MTIREYALNLLESCGCPENTYRGKFGEEYALPDMLEYAKEHVLPFTAEDIAKELIAIGNEPVYISEVYEYPDFDDWGSWGIADDRCCLYDKGSALVKALASGKTFDTGWHGFKKELQSMCVGRRDDGQIYVGVSAYMDDNESGPELISDCLTDEEERLLTDEMVEEIEEVLDGSYDFRTEETQDILLPAETELEGVLKEAAELAKNIAANLHSAFLECMGVTLYVLYGHPKDTKFISERMAAQKRE